MEQLKCITVGVIVFILSSIYEHYFRKDKLSSRDDSYDLMP